MKITLIGMAIVAASAGVVQQPQAAQPDVFLAPLTSSGGKVVVGAPTNISNSGGYDNQPFFLADSRGVLFASNRDATQTDIYRYDIGAQKLTQVTNTEENEYSPAVMPGGKRFSVIRAWKNVEGKDEQQVWQHDLDGNNASLVYKHTDLIGYYAWLSPTTMAMYVLGQPATLQSVETDSPNKPTVIDKGIGRSVLNRPDTGTISYISTATKPYMIKEFDPKSKKTSTIVKTLGDQEFCAWLPDGGLVTGQNSKLFLWRRGAADWVEIADLSSAKLMNISRLAVSPDGHWLAIVAIPQQ